MSHVQPCLQPLLPHEPVLWAFIVGRRPFVESGRHQGLIAAEVHQCSNPEWCDQLASSDRPQIWHKLALFKFLRSIIPSIPLR